MFSPFRSAFLTLVFSIALFSRCQGSDLVGPHSRSLAASQAGRHLLQTASSNLLPVVIPVADGGLSVAGSFSVQETNSSYSIDVNSYNVVAVPNGGIFASDTIRGSGCVEVNGATAGDGLVDYAVVLSNSLDAAVANGIALDTSLLQVVPGSQVVSQAVSGVVQLQPSLLYNILLLGPVDGPDLGFTAVQFNFTIYAPGAPECAAATPAPAPSAASPASAAVPYSASLVSSGLLPPLSTNSIGFTGATCITFELLQQLTTSQGYNIDLSAFVVTSDDYQNFSTSGTVDSLSSLSGVCRQTSSSLGSCTSRATNLDPTELYVLMTVNGLYTAQAQAVELPAVVRYGAQDGGTCSVTFPVDARSPGTAPSTGPSAAGPTSLQGPTSAVGTGSPAQSPPTVAPASPAAPTTPSPSPSPPVTGSPTVTSGASPPVVSGSLGGFSTGV